MTESFALPTAALIFPDFDNLERWFAEFLTELYLVSAAMVLGSIPFLTCI